MKMMRPRRLPKPATYQAWKWGKTAYPNSSKSPNLLIRCKLKGLLSSQGPAHSEVADTSSLEMQGSQMEAGIGFSRLVLLRMDLKVMYLGFFKGALWPEKEENLK